MYLFKLAERLGRTVGELVRTIDAHELAEWMAYDRIMQDIKDGKKPLDRPVEGDLNEQIKSVFAQFKRAE